MSELTKEWLLKTIAELEEERDAMPGVVNEDAAMALAAMKLALASLEAEPGVNHQPVAWQYKEYVYVSGLGYLWREKLDCEFPGAECETLKDVVPLYKAPPAPVSVPDAMEMDDDFDSAFEHGKAVGWNAYRAAMLQSFGNSEQLNSPVIPDGWVLVPEEPTHEMLEAGDEQFGTYDVYRRMIAAAPQQEVK
ncbi:hypothetical protein ACMGLT_00085 [Enterobacter hormaechei]|uniref:hypothetical protein n=1 Tax=Enterobacter hormaechei TaxID=158836 RepID=UPI0039C6D104